VWGGVGAYSSARRWQRPGSSKALTSSRRRAARRTAVHLAARAGEARMLQLLLKEQAMAAREALVNLADQYHITPVYLALQRCAPNSCWLAGSQARARAKWPPPAAGRQLYALRCRSDTAARSGLLCARPGGQG
jgi:hypothetical protein